MFVNPQMFGKFHYDFDSFCYIPFKQHLDLQDCEKCTPLMIAARHRRVRICKQLILKGSNIFLKNSKLQNVLHVTAQSNCIELVQYLVKRDLEETLVKQKDTKGRRPRELDRFHKFDPTV